MLYRVVGYKRYGTLTFYSDSRSLLFLALITANKTNMKSPLNSDKPCDMFENLSMVYMIWFRTNTMFHLPLVVCRMAHVLLTYLCLFAYSGIQHILCCVFVLFVYVWCILYCLFLWNVPFWVPLRYSLTFIYQYPNSHDITEILLKVALNTKNKNLQ